MNTKLTEGVVVMRSKSSIMLTLVVITFLIAGIAGYACASSDADHQGYQPYIAMLRKDDTC